MSMSFNPLGRFDPNAPLNPGIVAKAQAFCDALPQVSDGSILRCYAHWSVSPYTATFSDYNGMAVDGAGSWSLKQTHDPRDNVPGLTDNAVASHTWQRNTGAVGVAIAAMSGADVHDFGAYPVTVAGLDALCACLAAFAKRYNLDASGTVAHGATHDGDNGPVNTTGEPVIITHAEAAIFDGYFCGHTVDSNCRWDLASFVALPEGDALTEDMARTCGNALRKRIHAYKLALHA